MGCLLVCGPTVELTPVYLVGVERPIREGVHCSQNLWASVDAVVVVAVVPVDVFVVVVVGVASSARYRKDPCVEVDAHTPVAHRQVLENDQVVLD